jgi:stage III sporulation protein AG
MSEQNEQRELQEEMVLISIGDGESAVLIGQNYPVFQGALLVCEGGDDPLVRLRLTEALTALTGLSSNRVTVCKGS